MENYKLDTMGENIKKVQCPECLEWVEQEELDMFGGWCETCAEELFKI